MSIWCALHSVSNIYRYFGNCEWVCPICPELFSISIHTHLTYNWWYWYLNMDINIFERDYPNLNNTTPSKDINHLMQQKRRTLLTLHFLKSTLPRILYIYIYIYIYSLQSWNNTSYAVCWDKFSAFLDQQKFTKLYWTFNCNVWSVKDTQILNKKNKRTKMLSKVNSRS